MDMSRIDSLEANLQEGDNAECFLQHVWIGDKASNDAAANGQDSENGHYVWNCS